jgi:hypothetical protein
MIEELNAYQAASIVFPYLKRSRPIIFFLGAFISRKSPTGIPIANELKEEILRCVLQKKEFLETRLSMTYSP